MYKYQMEDGSIVNTEKSSQKWEEGTRFNGHNRISLATGSQWDHETLYRSRKGRYYKVHESQWQGSVSWAEWMDKREVVRWLLKNEFDDDDIPTDIKHLITEIEE